MEVKTKQLIFWIILGRYFIADPLFWNQINKKCI